MQLAILHYHLKRGGVTQAILNHLEALATVPASERPERVAIVFCGQSEGWPEGPWREQLPFDCHLVVVPSLEYDATVGAEPKALADAITHGLAEVGFDLTSTVLHTHNHALGKNASLPGALALLAERGCRMLLQIHDFAEDFRPANYRHLMRSLRSHSAGELAAQLYPQASGVHYATLTSRDQGLLSGAGIVTERLHLLPNPVAEFQGLPPVDDARVRLRKQLGLASDTRVSVYPVRGIRRKNVGEMLLHSAISGQDACYAITLAPENPLERASFDRWQDLADKLKLGCRFDIGSQAAVPFTDALAGADSVITTSVAEGFGMVFLEAWLAGQPLIGRNLSEITRDFIDNGLTFAGLRDELRVPLAWLDTATLRTQLSELHEWACHDFNVPVPADTAAQLDAMLSGDSIDFAKLPSQGQAEVIRQVAENRLQATDEIMACNEGFAADSAFDTSSQASLIASNAESVRREYSPEAVGNRLVSIYQKVLADSTGQPTTPAPAGESILEAFLRLDRLNPVRIEA